SLFGFTATASDAFTIGGVFGLNLLQEYYGKEITRLSIWISFLLLVFYGIISQIHIAFTPHACDIMHSHFASILIFMPRILIASFSVYLLVQHIDAFLYGT